MDDKQIHEAVDDAANVVDDAAKTFAAVGAGAAGFATARHLRRLRKKEPDRVEDQSKPAPVPRGSRVLKPSGDEYFPSAWVKPRRFRKVRKHGASLAGTLREYPAQTRRALRLVANAILKRPW